MKFELLTRKASAQGLAIENNEVLPCQQRSALLTSDGPMHVDMTRYSTNNACSPAEGQILFEKRRILPTKGRAK